MKSCEVSIRKLRKRYTPHYALHGFMESSATGYRSILSLENIGVVILHNMGPVKGKKIKHK